MKEIENVIAKRCGDLLDQGYHCSEAMLLGVGDLLFVVNPQTVKISTGFAGGIGCSKEDLCGALTGGLMVIGGLFGRTDPKTNDDQCQQLCTQYQQEFKEKFGFTTCCDLKENWVGKLNQERCVQLVERAAKLLLEILEV